MLHTRKLRGPHSSPLTPFSGLFSSHHPLPYYDACDAADLCHGLYTLLGRLAGGPHVTIACFAYLRRYYSAVLLSSPLRDAPLPPQLFHSLCSLRRISSVPSSYLTVIKKGISFFLMSLSRAPIGMGSPLSFPARSPLAHIPAPSRGHTSP